MPAHTTPWRPGQLHQRPPASELTPGQVAVFGRSAYRVLEVREIPQIDWDEHDLERWREAGQPDPAAWPARPLMIAARPDAAAEPDAEHFPVDGDELVVSLPEHYLVCRACGELPPCHHAELEEILVREQRRLAWLLGILPDCCHACRTPVTARQRAILFPGENLWRPDLGCDTALFHLRATCRGQAMRYDEQWAGQLPGRRRLLYCPGRLTLHYGGQSDCTEEALCPGAEVHHVGRDWHHPTAGSPYSGGCWCLAEEPAETETRSPAGGGAA